MKHLHDMSTRRSAPAQEALLERMFELAVRLTRSLDRGLHDRGLTPARAEVVRRLEPGALNQQQLSQALRCTPRNVTDLVDALEAGGLVARRPHPTDRRAVLVALTQKGRSAAARMRADERRVATALLGGIGREDLARFAAVLESVLRRLGGGRV